MENNCVIFIIEKLFSLIFCTLFGLGLLISKTIWSEVGLGLRFENSGLDLDRKI